MKEKGTGRGFGLTPQRVAILILKVTCALSFNNNKKAMYN